MIKTAPSSGLVTPKPTYPSMPYEVWSLILDYLPRSDLSRVARVNRELHYAVLPVLYRSVELLPPWNEGQHGHLPAPFGRLSKKGWVGRTSRALKTKYRKWASPDERQGLRLAGFKVAVEPSSGKSGMGKGGGMKGNGEQSNEAPDADGSSTHGNLSNRYDYTKQLVLHHHDYRICRKYFPSAFHMPRLETLIIRPQVPTYEPNTCIDPADPTALCPVLANLHPRRLILGGGQTGLMSFAGLWTPFPGPDVREVAIYVGNNAGIELGQESALSALPNIPSSVELVSLVFYPIYYDFSESGGKTWKPRRVAGLGPDGDIDPEFFWNVLARAASGSAQKVEIVGVETINSDWANAEVEARKEAVRDALKEMLWLEGIGMDLGELKSRVKGLEFRTIKEYLDAEHVRGGEDMREELRRLYHGVHGK